MYGGVLWRKIIDYEICALKEAGIEDIAVVGGYLFEVLKDFIASTYSIKSIFNNPNYEQQIWLALSFVLESG